MKTIDNKTVNRITYTYNKSEPSAKFEKHLEELNKYFKHSNVFKKKDYHISISLSTEGKDRIHLLYYVGDELLGFVENALTKIELNLH